MASGYGAGCARNMVHQVQPGLLSSIDAGSIESEKCVRTRGRKGLSSGVQRWHSLAHGLSGFCLLIVKFFPFWLELHPLQKE